MYLYTLITLLYHLINIKMKLLVILAIILLVIMIRYYMDIKRLIKKLNQMNDSEIKEIFNQKNI